MREEHWAAYLDCVGELLVSQPVQAMKEIRHHPGVSCFEHSLFVSYVAFRLARRWGRDGRAAARAGLLHDLYLYDPKSLPSYKQCFAHPLAAERNARALCGELSREEENGILAHMWPMARSAPPQPYGGGGVPGRQAVRHGGGAGGVAADGPVPDGLSAPARLRWKRGKETVKTAPSLCKGPKLEKKTGFFQNPGAFFRLLCYNVLRICPAAACPEGQQANPLFF